MGPGHWEVFNHGKCHVPRLSKEMCGVQRNVGLLPGLGVLLKLIIGVGEHRDFESIINSKKDLYNNYPTPKCPNPYEKEWWLLLHL